MLRSIRAAAPRALRTPARTAAAARAVSTATAAPEAAAAFEA
jgi:2-oxoglutarate dehydrogenase complex dehydrogenase (E1) component-like enzyme